MADKSDQKRLKLRKGLKQLEGRSSRMVVARRLRALREKAGFSQAEVSSLLGASRVGTEIERGLTLPYTPEGLWKPWAPKLAELYDSTLQKLFPEYLSLVVGKAPCSKDHWYEVWSERHSLYTASPDELYDHKELVVACSKALRLLTPREERIVRDRLGIDDCGEGKTLNEVGKDFELSTERIRCIEAKAFRKLRHPTRSRLLKDWSRRYG